MFEDILMGVFRLIGHLVGRLIRLVFDLSVFGAAGGSYARRHKKMEVIPLEAHFAHTLIVAGTGHGKTQLLQQLILYRIDDLLAEIESENKNPSSPSQYRNPPRRLKWIIPAIYGLLLLVWFVDFAPIIGLILAFTQRKAAVDTIYASHLRNQILVFCVGVGSLIVVALMSQYADPSPGIAKILLIAAICWIGWRITKGFYRAICQKDYSSPNPKSQKVQGGSIIVIDSQGDLIRKISHLAVFSPSQKNNINDRLILIDPNDTRYPPALNLFDFGLDRISRYDEVEREKLINGAIALYEYMFGALLGAELTNNQAVIFRNLARLLMVIPGATVDTLIELLQNPDLARPHFHKLDPRTRSFFETQLFSPIFDPTRQRILMRLWGVLSSSPSLARMFTQEHNKVNLYEAMNRGSIILINTAKDLLKQEGCEILGRFFIALVAQATQERAAISDEKKRRPTFVYIDEAADYFSQSDKNLENILSQARKYKVGVTLVSQFLDQFERKLQKTALANTAIKLAGGVSDDDARGLAREMRCEPEWIQQMKKNKKGTSFLCYVRDYTQEPIALDVLFGVLERRPRMTDGEYEQLKERNRKRYCEAVQSEPIQHTTIEEDDSELI